MYKKRKSVDTPFVLKCYQAGFQFVGSVLPAVAGRYAYQLWLQPRRFKVPASEKKVRESAIIKKVIVSGHVIVTYQWGTGSAPRVMLIHGWSGRGSQLGGFVPPLLEAGFRVMSFDLPAHGGSSGKQTNLLEVVEVIKQLFEQFGPFDSVIAHSFGGPCIALALKQGLPLRRVVVISPPATAQSLFNRFAEILHLTERTVTYMVQRLERQFDAEVLDKISMLNNVRQLTIPALIIHDRDDFDVDWAQGRAVAEAWQGAELITTNGLGHRRILRDEATITSTIQFLQRA